jgi:ketosteroid isomerase-like protein
MAGEWLESMFAAIDAKDADAFVRYLSEDARFRYGSHPAVEGVAAVRAAVAGFFSTIAGCSHRITGRWVLPEVAVFEGEVTYRRLDGRDLTLPFVDVLHLRGDRVRDYRIYIDPAPLFAP